MLQDRVADRQMQTDGLSAVQDRASVGFADEAINCQLTMFVVGAVVGHR